MGAFLNVAPYFHINYILLEFSINKNEINSLSLLIFTNFLIVYLLPISIRAFLPVYQPKCIHSSSFKKFVEIASFLFGETCFAKWLIFCYVNKLRNDFKTPTNNDVFLSSEPSKKVKEIWIPFLSSVFQSLKASRDVWYSNANNKDIIIFN